MIIIQCLKSSPFHISVSIINLFSKWLLLLLILNLENVVIAGCVCEDWIMSDLWRIIIQRPEKCFIPFFLFLLTFWFVYLINLSPSILLISHLMDSTICSILVKLNWSQSIGTEIRKRHLNGIMTAHDIFFDCSCKNFNRMSFPSWFMECFPFCLLLFYALC